MTKRSYNQYCGLAVALDLLGERWTMLVLRELLLGPRRFKDLLDGLPGIGTGLLSQRLKELEAAGVIDKATLPPPAGSNVYRLTEDGESLRPVLLGLTRWGMTRLGTPEADQYISSETLAVAVAARFNPATAHDAAGTHRLDIDARPFLLDIANGQVSVRAGEADRPVVSISTDSGSLIALINGTRTLADSLAEGFIAIDGDPAAIMALARAFDLAASEPE
ncbi:winged helix-turn-helix transcriptional regulator [Nocardia sp. NPDC020380]|uniref:winged helix-turn-helix transcriptional regulator n=1 Tax=Nocardia sp. NPDC020380 TaxID=3364309 RepID=UPI0037B9CAD2